MPHNLICRRCNKRNRQKVTRLLKQYHARTSNINYFISIMGMGGQMNRKKTCRVLTEEKKTYWIEIKMCNFIISHIWIIRVVIFRFYQMHAHVQGYWVGCGMWHASNSSQFHIFIRYTRHCLPQYIIHIQSNEREKKRELCDCIWFAGIVKILGIRKMEAAFIWFDFPKWLCFRSILVSSCCPLLLWALCHWQRAENCQKKS